MHLAADDAIKKFSFLQAIQEIFLAHKMAHLITGNKFDPNKDIPDLSGKVSMISLEGDAVDLATNPIYV